LLREQQKRETYETKPSRSSHPATPEIDDTCSSIPYIGDDKSLASKPDQEAFVQYNAGIGVNYKKIKECSPWKAGINHEQGFSSSKLHDRWSECRDTVAIETFKVDMT
jgi:hypothetical protein